MVNKIFIFYSFSGNPTYQQSFYWLNKDPASRMLMDKAKQKREFIYLFSYIILFSKIILIFQTKQILKFTVRQKNVKQ